MPNRNRVLATPYIAQVEYKSKNVKILRIDDDTDNDLLRVHVQLGPDPSYKYWIPVLDSTNYTTDWTTAQVNAAIDAYFV